jgi:hypothetical protein
MPEDIEKALELARPSASEPASERTVSTSARIGRGCGFLALGSVVLFWLLLLTAYSGYERHGGDPDIVLHLLAGEGLLLLGLSPVAIICAIIGFVGARRHPGNWKVAGLAILLTLVAVAGFLAPIIIYLSSHPLRFW